MKKALGYVLWLFALLALYPVILDGNDAALLHGAGVWHRGLRSGRPPLEASQVDIREPLRSGPTLAKL